MMIMSLIYPQLVALVCTLRLASSTETLIRSNFKRERILQEELLSLNKARDTMDTLLACNLPVPIIKILRETNGDFDSVTSGNNIPVVEPTLNLLKSRNVPRASIVSQTSSAPRKVSVMFCEFVDSAEMNETSGDFSNPLDHMVSVVRKINTVLATIEEVVNRHGGELVKSMETKVLGNNFHVVVLPMLTELRIKVLIACGISILTDSNATAGYEDTAFAIAVDLLDAFANRSLGQSSSAYIKIGLHTGPVSSAIIGDFKFAYDVFGDTVNIASRMMSMARAWNIFMTGDFAGAIQQTGMFKLTSEGRKTVKGKGTMNIWSFTTPELLARNVNLSKGSGYYSSNTHEVVWGSMDDPYDKEIELGTIMQEMKEDNNFVNTKTRLNLAVKKATKIRSLFKQDFNTLDVPDKDFIKVQPSQISFQTDTTRSDIKQSNDLPSYNELKLQSSTVLSSVKSTSLLTKMSTTKLAESERVYRDVGKDLIRQMEDDDMGIVVDEILKMSSQQEAVIEKVPEPEKMSSLWKSIYRFLKENMVQQEKSREITSKFINKIFLTYKNPRFELLYRSTILLGKNEMFGLVYDCIGVIAIVGSDIIFSAIAWAYAGIPHVDSTSLDKAELGSVVVLFLLLLGISGFFIIQVGVYNFTKMKRVADEEGGSLIVDPKVAKKILTVNCIGILAFSFITISIISLIHVTFGTIELEYQPILNTVIIFTVGRFHGAPFIWHSPISIVVSVIIALAATSHYERDRIMEIIATYNLAMLASAFIIYSQEKWRRESYLIEMAGIRARMLCSNELERSKFVLSNTFNDPVITLLTQNPKAGLIQRSHNAAVLALDIAGFTVLSSKLTATEVVTMLNEIYRHFDAICLAEGVEKICTIGDAYIAVSGLPKLLVNPSLSLCRVAIQMQRIVASINLKTLLALHPERQAPPNINTRIGIYSGEVCCALIGGNVKLKYDVIGKAVGYATKLEQTAVPGGVHVSKVTVERVGEACVFKKRLDLVDLINGEVSFNLMGIRDEEMVRKQ
ncbi:hypothetical protein HDU76_004816 [Blyttiomyces sp. JEL0837]|nr:hypothetical protein HDU76_004816 [Blyttiomyces sp. JEL0837]